MDVLTLSINIALVVFAAASAGAAFWQARVAASERSAAESARQEAQQLSEKAVAASERQALAQEAANELARETSRPKPALKLEQVSRDRWALSNVGLAPLVKARLQKTRGHEDAIVHFDDDEARDVAPGDSLFFNFIRTGNGAVPRITLTGTDRSSGEDIAVEQSFTLP